MKFTRVVRRNLTRHPVRSFLTIGSMVVAVFLLCLLRSLIVALDAGVQSAKSNRLWVQSATSLFVELPLSYQAKIEAVDGVVNTGKWQWFGGIYQDPANFFAQFAVDGKQLLEIYPEIEIVEGSSEEFLRLRNGCIIGRMLASTYDWKVGDRIPLIGGIFPHPEGGLVPWEFEVTAIYEPQSTAIDGNTMFFNWAYFQESMELSGFTPGVGTIVLETEPNADQTAIMRSIDTLFENGPQRVQTTTEAEFQAQFVSMLGSIPFFINSIGGGVLMAILLACVNTMLMSFREQTRDIGVFKALGFTDRDVFLLLIAQALAMCVLGGLLGVAASLATEPVMFAFLGNMFPGYQVTNETALLGILLSIGIGIVAGISPAIGASRLRVVDALRAV